MKSFSDIVSWMALLIGIEIIDDEQPSLEIADLVTNAVAPESNCMRPSVPYDPDFRFMPIPLTPDRPQSKENSHTVCHMPDESNDEPDSYVRYDSSSGRADTSGIEAYWNRPPPENFIPPPPYWPPVSYVPPPPPEHVEAVRYEPPVQTPAAQTGDEELIDLFTEQPTQQPGYGTTSLGVQHELDRMREKVTELSQLLQLEQMKNFDLQQRITKLEAEKDEIRRANQTAPSAYQNGQVRASQHQARGREPPQNQAQVTMRRLLAELEKEKERKRNAEYRPKDQRKVNFFQQFLPPPFRQWNVRIYLAHKNPKHRRN
ncbi:hypothetical protein OUZ56_015960 [Daphnia magna]|uniref:Uncharacterized protein n=1 Tax=Daphnia magna TaxID=35525 RepID=A0ABR0AP93_9CRUS|nr:hypothetical protein OUZ56_015960 [Daphnia magna]